MLSESVIRVGHPIKTSNMSNKDRIRMLTDCDSINCKNFFQNVFLIEIGGDISSYHYLTIGSGGNDFLVDKNKNTAYPIFYPTGGNPLHAQGNYPIACYLMYDRHINDMKNPDYFADRVAMPRLEKTISYMEYDKKHLIGISQVVAKILADNYNDFIDDAKQLGILYIYDHSLDEFHTSINKYGRRSEYFNLTESNLYPSKQLHLDSSKCIENIIKAKFAEAKTLGHKKDAVSTFTNKVEDEIVSIYNKYWPWLSPTWEAPRSIYWSKNDWTPGIKVDKLNYESYLYGSQFLNRITLPIRSGILKEMFAPITSVEAKQNMRPASFETIYGLPIVLPLIDINPEQTYKKYEYLIEKDPDKKDSDIHLGLIAGIDTALPKIEDEYRLTLLYYSGDMSRGDVHIRMIIEDVVPSVAKKLEGILKNLSQRELPYLQEAFYLKKERKIPSLESLPSMLGNAYGPGFVWSSLEAVLNKKPIHLKRLYTSSAIRLSELANKEKWYEMINELLFFHGFLIFHNRYSVTILGKGRETNYMINWQELLNKYQSGKIESQDLQSSEDLGFVTGLLLKQFSNSYHHAVGNDFIKHRVMTFGSKLTPEVIWKNGLLKCEELALQRDLGLGANFRPNLSRVLLAILDANKNNLLEKEKDKFMTAFWSGYLMYRKQKEA